MHKNKGFTLIELIMVIILIGIIAAYGMPRMFATNPFEERGFFDGLVTALRYAQRLAIASRCDTLVTITSNSYTITTRSAANNLCNDATALDNAVFNPLTGAMGYTVQIPTGSGVTLSPASTIQFRTSGSITGNANVTITVSTATRTIGRITVHQATGFVEQI